MKGTSNKLLPSIWHRATSRKFLLAIAGLATLGANKQWTEFVIVLMGYLGVEGAADTMRRNN